MKKFIKYVVLGLVIVALVLPISCTAVEEEAETQVLKLGLISPFGGPWASIGLLKQRGFEVWADDINARGGVTVGGVTYMIQPMYYDDKGFVPAEALKAVKKGVLEDETYYYLATSTGALVEAVAPFLKEQGGLLFTWGASPAMRPEWPHVIGLFTYWPQYHTLGVEYLAERYPEVKTAAYLAPDAPYGRDDQLWMEIAAAAQGIELVYNEFVPLDIVDWYPVVTAMLATNPDAVLLGAHAPGAQASIMEAAMSLGYEGKWYINSFELPMMLPKIPVEYLNGVISPGGPLDDAAIVGEAVQGLYQESVRRWPGEWNLELTSIWFSYPSVLQAMEIADSVDPVKVGETLLAMDPIDHPYLGVSSWGGMEIWGADHFLLTPFYFSEVIGDEQKTVAVLSFTEWYEKNKAIVTEIHKEKGLLP